MLRKWCEDNHFKLYEDIFKEKPATHGGMETELKWTAKRKETPFIKWFIKFNIKFKDNYPVEVVQNGEKKQLFKARVEFIANPYLQYDWQNQYKGKIAKYFLWFLWDKIFKYEWIKKHGNVLNGYVFYLGEDVKKFLNMYAHSGIYY